MFCLRHAQRSPPANLAVRTTIPLNKSRSGKLVSIHKWIGQNHACPSKWSYWIYFAPLKGFNEQSKPILKPSTLCDLILSSHYKHFSWTFLKHFCSSELSLLMRWSNWFGLLFVRLEVQRFKIKYLDLIKKVSQYFITNGF